LSGVLIHSSIDTAKAKGWSVGPWNSGVPIPIRYANESINEKHYHSQMFEVYLVAKGCSTALVNAVEVELQAGDILVVEPHEVHSFLKSSEDYLHFVIQVPFVKNDKFLAEI
jgi:quercetin dioxygenase-like cupin family protein